MPIQAHSIMHHNFPFTIFKTTRFLIESFKNQNPQITDQELIDISPEIILLQSKYDE